MTVSKDMRDLLVAVNERFAVVGTPPPLNRAQRRAQRRHHRARVAVNRRKIAVAKGMDHVAEHSDNMLAVKHPFDCGGRCLMCHGEKILGSTARRQRERVEALSLEEAAEHDDVRVRFQRHYT